MNAPRGGARPGAGRKPANPEGNMERHELRLPPGWWPRLKTMARQRGKPVADFLRGIIRSAMDRDAGR